MLAKTLTRLLSVIAILIATTLVNVPQAIAATTFEVDTTADTVDANPGNGTCADSGGDCSLRAAVMESNALAGTDTIEIPDGTYELTLSGVGENNSATGDLDIKSDINLTATGLVEIKNGSSFDDRIFDIQAGTSVFDVMGGVDGLTLTNNSETFSGNGGCVLNNATSASLIFDSVTFGECYTNGSGGGVYIGAGELAVSNAGFVFNSSSTGCGGAVRFGGLAASFESTAFVFNGNDADGGAAICQESGEMDVENSVFSLNLTGALGDGGAISHLDGDLTVTDSLILGNGGDTLSGGGIYSFSTGTLDITGTTFADNAAGTGAGVYMFGPASSTIVNSTFSGNIAEGFGGGIYNDDVPLAIQETTFGSNEAGANNGAGIYSGTNNITTIHNSILGNTDDGKNCVNVGSVNQADRENISSDSTCGFAATRINTNPMLGALESDANGVYTLNPAYNSPALHTGDVDYCSATDQRGVARPQGAGCDVGAVELQQIYKPDSTLRFSGSLFYLGENIYTTDNTQIKTVKVHKGRSINFYHRVQNDGTYPDRFFIKGPGSNSVMTVKYMYNSTDITSAVVAGTFKTKTLLPGMSYKIAMVITVHPKARSGYTRLHPITSKSVLDPTKLDRVIAGVFVY